VTLTLGIHVRFTSRFGWTVEREGVDGHLSAHCTQSLAERFARALAQRERTRLFVHGFGGDVIRFDSFAARA
jgi:hypothetical protein